MYIRRKAFSVAYDENGEEKLFSTTEIMSEEAYLEKLYSENEKQKEFGAKSKALGLFAPGSYQAKEAAKYGYDEDEYKKKRGGYALKGFFAPGTSTYMKKKAQEMYENGKSQAEIREFLENKGKHKSNARVAAGVAEALTGFAGGLGHQVATGVGLYDKVTGHRMKYKKKD